MSTALGSMAIGSTVRIRESGTLREFLVVHHGNPSAAYQGYQNATFLLRRNTLPNRQMHSSNVNDYQNSTLHAWFNGEYFNMIDADIRNQIIQGRIPFRPGSGTSTAVNSGANGLLCRIFALSAREYGIANGLPGVSGWSLPNNEGVRFSFFLDGNEAGPQRTTRIATNDTGGASHWWGRSPSVGSSTSFWHVLSGGSGNDANGASFAGVAPRPAFALPSSLSVSDSGDITVILPPTTPPSINVPATVLAGTAINISWGASTDPQGQAITYIVERQINGGAWSQIHSGMGLSTTNVVAVGSNTVAYRVRARNTAGLESEQRTSPTRTVTNNDPPTIDGSDSDLGLQDAPFIQSYVVNDPNPGDVVTVTERMNGVQVRQYQATLGATQGFNVNAVLFVGLGNGTHTMTVTAQDQAGASVVRTWTFNRQESQIDITLENPMAATDKPGRILVNVNRQIPQGATFKVEVCNNAFDGTPTWEDATAAVLGGNIYHFTNETLATSTWGVNIRVTVERGSAVGLCFIASVGGNFDGGVGAASTNFELPMSSMMKGV